MLVKGVCAVAVRFNLISAPPSRGGAEACSDRRIMLAKSLPLGNSFAALKPPPVGRKFTQELLPPKARGRDLS